MAEAAATKNYEDFEPSTDTVREKDCDIILFYIPGFKKEQLRVQVTAANSLSVSGEREIADSKFIRFNKQFPITPDIDSNGITAKFERGILFVRLPKPESQKSTKAAPDSAGKVGQNLEEGKHEKPGRRGKTREGTAADQAAKLSMSKRTIFGILVGLAAVGVGLYVTTFMRFSRTPQVSG